MSVPTFKQVLHLILAAFPKAVVRGKTSYKVLIYHDGVMSVRGITETPKGVELTTGGSEYLITCGDDLLGWISDHRGRIGPVEKDHWPQTLAKQPFIPEVVRMCWHNPMQIGMPDFINVSIFGCTIPMEGVTHNIVLLRPGDPESPWECACGWHTAKDASTRAKLTTAHFQHILKLAYRALYPLKSALEYAQGLIESTKTRYLIMSPDMYARIREETQQPLPEFDGISGVIYTDNTVSVTVDPHLPAGTMQEVKPQSRSLSKSISFASPYI